jgi:hypothetical protein
MRTTQKCTAKRRDGQQCTMYAMLGQNVCRMHGGKSPQAMRKAALRVIEGEALAAVSKFGAMRPVTDPLSALQEVVGELVAVKDWIRGRVELIDAEIMRTTDDKMAEQMRAEWTAYTGMLNSCVNGLATLGKLNIDERMAKIDETMAEHIITALKHGFAAAGVTGDALNAGLAAAGRHLRSVAA